MPSTLTDAELTILGLLVETPRHGYDLERVIDERGIRNWTALGFSSIYYVLDKLTARGLIEAVERGRAAKSRVPYRPTVLGREVCATASLDAIATLTPLRVRVLVGMANSLALSDVDISARLAQRAQALKARLDEVRAARSHQQPLPAAADAIFDYSEALLRADLVWTESALDTLTKESQMDKYDIKKAYRELYSPSSEGFTFVDVPTLHYLAVDGHGDPNTSAEYADAVEALYAVAYALKFESKSLGRDFTVGPLEGLWWASDMTAYTSGDKSSWDWTMMIAQPDWITEEQVRAAAKKVAAKKNLAALPKLRLLTLDEGRCAQILHMGSYDDEAPTLDRLHHQYLPQHGVTFNGLHHEIYLSDPRRTAPTKLKTVLRQPVRPA